MIKISASIINVLISLLRQWEVLSTVAIIVRLSKLIRKNDGEVQTPPHQTLSPLFQTIPTPVKRVKRNKRQKMTSVDNSNTLYGWLKEADDCKVHEG